MVKIYFMCIIRREKSGLSKVPARVLLLSSFRLFEGSSGNECYILEGSGGAKEWGTGQSEQQVCTELCESLGANGISKFT